jgi:hypothetical protein
MLKRHGHHLPANQKHQPLGKLWQRYEKPQPGHRLQLDVKFLERIPGTRRRLYQFTAIDDCTRIRVAADDPNRSQPSYCCDGTACWARIGSLIVSGRGVSVGRGAECQ